MADDADFSTDATPTLQQLATFFADELFSVDRVKRLENLHRNAHAEGATIAAAAQTQAAPALSERKGQVLGQAEDFVSKAIAEVCALLVGHMLGVELPPFSKAGGMGHISNSSVGAAVADVLVNGIAGDGGQIEPGDAGARRLIGMIGHLTLTGWFEGIAFEELTSLFGTLHAPEAIADLGHQLVDSLGLSRMVRRALQPMVNVLMTTPLQWKLHKDFRPTLLGASEIVQAFTAGDYTREEATEELSRLGFSDKRQDIILKSATKFMSIADSLLLVRDGLNDRQLALDNARLAGYDEVGATAAVLVEEVKHLNSIRDDSASAVKAAYVDRRIDDGQLDTYLSAIYVNDEDRSAYETAWRTIRDLNTKRLSPSQAETLVKAHVLPIAAYREALRLDGYDEEAVLALELYLETQLNADADVAALRKQKADELAAEQKTKADAAAAKQKAVDEARALARRGSLADLRRAVVTGLIPTSRYAEVLTPQYDADTVATLVALVEQDRAAYVAQQQKAADAAKRATLRHIDVGALQTAYYENVLTADQVRASLTAQAFAPEDIDVLVATMQARKSDLDAAKAKRDDAAAKAKTKSIDLGRFEALVLAGHRSIADYMALLASLDYDEASQAAMADLLQLRVADDQKAREQRAAVAAKSAAQGLTLEQLRRGVILGAATVDDFQRYLVANKFTSDAQVVLLAELRDDVTQADAARAKRTAAEAATVETRAPLSTVARAARLGLVSPDVYQQRLVDAKYTADDIAIEMDLLAVEIADTQAARAKAAAAEAAATDRGLSLEQLAKAVKVGAATVADYQARAAELGYAADAVAALVAVLSDEVQAAKDAQARHDAIDGQLKARNLSLSELDDAVKNGLMTMDAYAARLAALGYAADDVDLLVALLALKLPAPPAAGETP